YPNRYEVLRKALLAARGNRREMLTKIHRTVKSALPAAGIEADIVGREKSLYSIFRKFVAPKKTFSDVLDIHGLRMIDHTLTECYLALVTLHQLYRPVPGKFKDYNAIPKINGSQSLPSAQIAPYGALVDFQLLTVEMSHVAE